MRLVPPSIRSLRCPAAPAFPPQDYGGETNGVKQWRRRHAEERSARGEICFALFFLCFFLGVFLGVGVLLLLFFS